MEQAGLVGDLARHRRRTRGVSVRRGEGAARGDRRQRPLPRWLPPYVHGLFATAPQLGWQRTNRSRDITRPRVEPDRGQQRRDARQRPAHPCERRRVVPLARHAGVAGHRRVHGRRRRDAPRRRRGRARHTATRSPRRARRRRTRRPDGQGGAVRRHQRRARPRTSSTRRCSYEASRPRAAVSAPPASSSTTTPRAWSTSPRCSRASCTSSRAGSAHRASSARAKSRARSTTSPPGRGDDDEPRDGQPLARCRRRQPLLPTGRRAADDGQPPAARSRPTSTCTCGDRVRRPRDREVARSSSTSSTAVASIDAAPAAQAARLDIRARGRPVAG